MKNLKKILSLVLVIVMAFSMMAVAGAAGVADYSDASSITNTEAVDLLSNSGILQGYTDGTFKPAADVTREEAAKIVTYVIMGNVAADRLRTSTSKFSDVAATRWSAPYIDYCATKGIIDGVGNGKFNPTGKVTHSQLAKMLLTAAGYGKKGEYVGSSWEIEAIYDAQRLGVLTLDRDYSSSANREDVAQTAFNAYTKVDLVALSKDTDSYVYVKYNIASNSVEQTYSELHGITKVDTYFNGVQGHMWYRDGIALTGNFVDAAALATSTNGTKISDLTNRYGVFYKASLDPVQAIAFYYNGKAIAPFSGTIAYAVGALFTANNTVYRVHTAIAAPALATDPANTLTSEAAKYAEYSVTGSIVNFLNEDNDTYAETVTIIEKTVDFVTRAPVVSGKTVTIGGITGSFNVDNIIYPAGLAKDDVVLWYTDEFGITYVEKATSIDGQRTSFSSVYGTQMAVFAGESRALSALGGKTITNTFNATDFPSGRDATIWIDNNGNIVHYVLKDTSATANYCYVESSNNLTYTVYARLVLADGSMKSATIASVDNITGDSPAADTFYSYTVGADGTYNLYAVNNTTVQVGTLTDATITRAASFGGGFIGSSNTAFVVRKSATALTFSAYTGIANAPTYTTGGGGTNVGATGKVLSVNGIAVFVYIEKGDMTSATSGNYLYIPNFFMYNDNDASGSVVAHRVITNAVINGEINQTISLAASLTVTGSGTTAISAVAPGLYEYALMNGIVVELKPINADAYNQPMNAQFVYQGYPVALSTSGSTLIVDPDSDPGVTGDLKYYSLNANSKVILVDAYGVVTVGDTSDLASADARSVTVQLAANTTDTVGIIYVHII